ncbi:MAG TPA: divergent polysaccharide deacetylase family protein, partial [Alphaproteobacteria bacterium]|nr:divergent polysaccharide deacetylase family protein [Alphaproteobacteria bacterium]
VEAEAPDAMEIPAALPAADPAPPEPPPATDASPAPPPAPPAEPPMPAEAAETAAEEAAPVEPPVEAASAPEGSEGDRQVAALPPAPDPALIESALVGPLPRIGPDGKEPWQAYARPFDAADGRPRIAIVITDLGQSGAATETAIQGLPGPVTLAFAPYAPRLQTWLPEARAAGHETLLMVPMEPTSYPRNDPGPHTLLTSLSPAANHERLNWVLSQANGYVGVVNSMGSRLTTAPEALRPVLEALDSRGLMFLDSRTAATSVAARVAGEIGLPHADNDRFIDDVASRDAIDRRLRELEALAREQGYAVGMAYPYPVSFERLAAWIPTLEEKGFVLAPISAIAAAPQDHSG